MREVYKVDVSGFYVEPLLVQDGEEVEKGLIDIRIPDGFHTPRFDGSQWVEGKPQEEIDSLNNTPKQKTEAEQISELQSIVDQLLLDSLMGV